MFHRWRVTALGLAVATALLLMTGGALPALAAATGGANGVSLDGYELDLLNRTNDARASAGLPGLNAQAGTTDVARGWADVLAQRGTLSHNPDVAAQLQAAGSSSWTTIAENVGQGGSSAAVFQAYLNSPAHRANILRANVSFVGIGAAVSSDGRVWDVMVFVDSYSSSYGGTRTSAAPITAAGTIVAPTPAPPSPGRFVQARDDAGPGAPAHSFNFGSVASTTLACDVNGDGKDDVVAYQNGYWAIRYSASSGAADTTFAYGFPGAIPVCGNWDGVGGDGIGVYFNGTWYLRQTATPGIPDAGIFSYGWPGAKPVTGDWNGGGRTGIGIYDTNVGSFWLRNTANAGAPATVYQFGWGTATPVTGDFNGDGRTDTGVYAGGRWYLRDSATPGATDRLFDYGGPGAAPVVGHFGGQKADGVGVSWGS